MEGFELHIDYFEGQALESPVPYCREKATREPATSASLLFGTGYHI